VTQWWLARRLAWRLALVLIAAVALAAVAVGWRAIVTARSLEDASLQAQVAAIAAGLVAGPNGAPRLDLPSDLTAAFEASHGTSVFVVTDQSAEPLLSSDARAAALLVPFLPMRDGFLQVPVSNRYPEGMVGFVTHAGRWRVAVAQSREQSEVLVSSLLTEFFSTGLVLLSLIGAVAVAISVVTVRQGLRPLLHASTAAAAVDASRPGVRLPEDGLPGEVTPLVAAVNQALARLEAALGAQRRFVGDAAHTLRTPLAVLTARLDTLPEAPETAALRRDADRMARLIEQMLQMTRLDGTPLDVSKAVDLHAVAVEAISALAPLALRHNVELVLSGQVMTGAVTGNHSALVIALVNLLENALAHAPPQTLIELSLEPPARLSVLDRGCGVPKEERTLIFDRFRRGRIEGSVGAGLGLAIVAGIAAAHHGSVRAIGRDGGGVAFVLELGTFA
jgi:two-component system sensor histidine kinase TctE